MNFDKKSYNKKKITMKYLSLVCIILFIHSCCSSNYLRGSKTRRLANYTTTKQCDNEIIYKSIYELWLDCLITYKTKERQRANLIH